MYPTSARAFQTTKSRSPPAPQRRTRIRRQLPTSDAGATRETDGDDDGETRVARWEKIPDECRRKRETKNPPKRDDDDDDDDDADDE